MQDYFAKTVIRHARISKEFINERRKKMKKKKSLMERVKLAERREQDAKRRMNDMQRRLIQADLQLQGTLIWLFSLACTVGPVIHISAEEVKKGKTVSYHLRMNENGSMDMIEEGYFERLHID